MDLPSLLAGIRRIYDLPRLTRALGYHPVCDELPAGAILPELRVVVVGRCEDFAWYATDAPGPAVPRLAAALMGRGIPAAVLGLDREARRLTVAAERCRPLAIDLDAPDGLAMARIRRTARQPAEPSIATPIRIAEALTAPGVDQRFYAGFRRALEKVMASYAGAIPRVERHALGLLLLTRILFLYFIEARGWLAARPRFLREEVDRCLAARRSLHRQLLQPLFFGTLNRAPSDRSALARRFGRIPFLNGGLFEPHPLERRWQATCPTPVLRDVFDELFDRFHFALINDGGESIDPDMLGRVFEGVMAPEERHDSGSFYTPRVLVDQMLRDAFATWLSHRLKLPWASAQRCLEDRDPRVRPLLREVRLLDPALGSGAFLLGALRLLGQDRAAALRGVLARSLYGVDRNAAAVRLAELRLWLDVVAAEAEGTGRPVRPLPNLDALVRQGDSLVDHTGGRLTVAEAGDLGRLRREAVGAVGEDKRRTIRALRRAEGVAAERSLQAAIADRESRIAELLDAARSPSLFGDRKGLGAADRRSLRTLRGDLRRLRSRVRTLRQTGEVPWFSYETQFADVLAAGGFDLVVGNPPWVRSESLPPESRRFLRERYRWMRRVGTGRGYVHQPDLAVAFLERALELTSRNGVVAFLVPAKLATTGYAAVARAELARTTTVALAASLTTSGAAFDATVYPMALITGKAPPPARHEVRLHLGHTGPVATIPQARLSAAPWPLALGAAGEVAERLHRAHRPLGDRFTCHLGVKTGLNQAFLARQLEVEPALVRWAIRGRDVGPFRIAARSRLFWPCDDRGNPLPVLPPDAARHVAPLLPALRRRADYRSGPAWTLFRTAPAVAPHRVIWADVARRLEAAPLSGAGSRQMVPLNTCYVIPCLDPDATLRLAGFLNSTWCRVLARATAEPASGGFARFNARVVAGLPLPDPALCCPRLLTLAIAGVEGTLQQEELDACCADLLELTENEQRVLARITVPDPLAGRGAAAGGP